MMSLTQLAEFRQALYDCLGKAKDAIFELMDAVLVSPSIQSFVSLSQSPVFRRQWSSVYAALHDSRPPRRKLLKLLVQEINTETVKKREPRPKKTEESPKDSQLAAG